MTDSLTGIWDGTYTHPQIGIVTFLATLIEAGGALGGNVTEPCATPGCPLSTHHASIAGQRSGGAGAFVKRYEQPGHAYDTVSYEGSVDANATEVDGCWKLPGSDSRHIPDGPRDQPALSVEVEEPSKEPVR